jgi:hypothetical protein
LTLDPAVGINKVIDATCDAAFFVTAAPSSVFKSISSSADVNLISVQMPAGKKTYDENGTIHGYVYPFQDFDVGRNISIKTLLVAGPNYDDSNVALFLEHIFSHVEDYKLYNKKWEDVSLGNSIDFMMTNPQMSNYRAMAYIAGFPEIDPFFVEPLLYTGHGLGSYHIMGTELIWLMSNNIDLDMREKNSTEPGKFIPHIKRPMLPWPLSRMIFFLILPKVKTCMTVCRQASMKKVIPLQYEYVHLLVSTNAAIWTRWTGGGVFTGYPKTISNFLTDPRSDPNGIKADLYLNVGPKTSGTFITAMEILNSYKTKNGEPFNFENLKIHWSFGTFSCC